MSTHNHPLVAVLLATYNGKDYISAQIDSITSQVGCAVHLWVSDDQSTDGTWEWLQERAAGDPRFHLLPRIGRFGNAARNFYRLFRDADLTGYEFVALSDQDDLWLASKLERCISRARELGAGAVSSNVTAFWPDGRQMLIHKAERPRRFDFLFGSAGPGCTYTLCGEAGRQFQTFVTRHWTDINSVDFHDWIIYAWARSQGINWHIESIPTMLYRQHGKNELGAHKGVAAIWRRFKQIRSGWYRRQVLSISRLIAGGPAFSAECAHIVSLVEHPGIANRIALLSRIGELRRAARDRAALALACMTGYI